MSCMLCNSTTKTQKEGKFLFVVCQECAVKYHYPLPTSAYLTEWYSEKSFSKRWSGKLINAINVNEAQNKSILDVYFNFILETCANLKGKMVLDIGCYAGNFLCKFKDAGSTCIGIDLNSGLVKYGRDKFNLDLRVGDLKSFAFSNNSFDIITFNQVLEHLNNPVDFMREVYRILKKPGIIEFSVPDYAINKKISFPNHLFHYIDKSVKKLMTNTGFVGKVISRKDHLALIAIGRK